MSCTLHFSASLEDAQKATGGKLEPYAFDNTNKWFLIWENSQDPARSPLMAGITVVSKCHIAVDAGFHPYFNGQWELGDALGIKVDYVD